MKIYTVVSSPEWSGHLFCGFRKGEIPPSVFLDRELADCAARERALMHPGRKILVIEGEVSAVMTAPAPPVVECDVREYVDQIMAQPELD